MSVSGKEEPEVLSRKSSTDISAGIPLKKRRFLLYPPSSPPRQEPLPEVNDAKKNEESILELKNKENSGSDSKEKEESCSELKKKEVSSADVKDKEESGSNLGMKEGSGSELERKEESGSDLQSNVESTPDLKNKEKSSSDQGASSLNAANKSPVILEVSKINLLEVKKESVPAPNANLGLLDKDVSGLKLPELSPMVNMASASRVENKTKLLLTGKSASADELSPMVNMASASRVENKTKLLLTGKSAGADVPGTTVGAVLRSVKKEIHSKQVEEDCKLKLSTGSGNDKLAFGPKESLILDLGHQNAEKNSQINESVDPSFFSLSISKEKHISEEKSGDASLNNISKFECSNRSNWDLNTTMDDWEGSIGDASLQSTTLRGSGTTACANNGRPISSAPVVRVSGEKGKQVVVTNEPRSNFLNSSVQLNRQSEDSLRLTLSSSFRGMDFVSELSGLSPEVVPRTDVSTNLHSGLDSTLNKNSSGVRLVKSEPTDENSKNNSVGATNNSTELLDFNAVKREPIQKHNIEAVKLSASSPQELTGQRSIKSEPTIELCQELCRTPNSRLKQSIAKFVHSQESGSSSGLPMPLTPQKPSPSRLPTSSELSTSADVSNQCEHSVHTKEVHMGSDAVVQAAADMTPMPVHQRVREGYMAGHNIETSEAEVMNVVDPEMKRTKEHMHDWPVNGEGAMHDLPVNGEGAVSDEEKINISAETMEDESYGSECESDGNQAVDSHLGTQGRGVKDDYDYEDGEVRDPLEHSKIEDPTADRLAEDCAKHADCDNTHSPSGFPGDTNTDHPHLDDKENELEIHDNTTVDCIMESVGTVSNENNEQITANDGPSENWSSDGMAAAGADNKEQCNSSQRKLLDQTGKKSSQESKEKDISCDGTISSGSTMVTTAGEAKGELVKAVNMAEKPNSSLSIVETSLNGNNAAKDSTSGGNKSRIINLPRASVTSPCKTRSIPDRLPSSRNGRERYLDLDGEKSIPRGNRDEIDYDGPHRFIRERIQDQSFRNSRSSYTRGRGRFSGRLDTSRSEWGSDRDFALGSYNDDYRFTRNKRAAAISDVELECDDYVIPPDGAALSSGRGRKSLNDDLPSFRHPSSRRLSPGGRDGPVGREIQILRRISRNISPSRRNDENGVDLAGLGHDEKFVRGLSDDIIDPAYTRPHSMYDGGDSQFVRGNRNYSAFQRRGFPRVRSKSPVGSRTRTPGPWSSPRRRPSDGFSGLPQLAQHRSPAMYGVERMRSPDHSCFPEEMAARRRSSPSYLVRPSNDSRDVDSGREHGHPRPINSSRRSPSDRVFSRSTRRLDVLDPRIRTGDDEYFGRPVPSGRFHEFHGEGSNDERRKCGERRGLIRPFRSPYTGDSNNLRFHLDDCPRPFRFCSDGDPEFVGRGIREREFDGRMKSRPIVAPRRIQNIDDQDGNYRHNGQVWHDDGFNDGSRFKRRRF